MTDDTYRVSQVAKVVGIAPNTVRSWTDKFGILAQAGEGDERRYTDDDIALFRTVKVLRDQGEPMKRIKPRIAEGERLEPPETPAEATEPAQDERIGDEEPSAIVTRLTATVAKFEGELNAVKDERDRLAGQLADAQAAHLAEVERRAAAEARAELLESNLVLSVVHSEAMPDHRPEPAAPSPWWAFWRRD